MKLNSYQQLAKTLVIHFILMYALTYAPVNVLADVPLFSTRSFYMAALMVAPMIIFMLIFMKSMYTNKRLNIAIYIIAITIFTSAFWFIRQQIFVNDQQFLASMIPHHSSAITMCEKASITDPEIITLCENIIQTQQNEIDQMKEIQKRLNR